MDFTFASFTVISVIFVIFIRFNRPIFDIFLETELNDYYSYFAYMYIFSVFFTVLTLFFIVALGNKTDNVFSRFFQDLLQKIKKYNIFYLGYNVIFEKIAAFATKYFMHLVRYILNMSENLKQTVIFVFVVLPKIMIIFTLFVEVFFLQRLYYYFICLILLLIPLFFRLLVFIMRDLKTKLLPVFQDMLLFQESGSAQDIVFVTIKLKPEHEDVDLDDLLYNFYYPLTTIGADMDFITYTYITYHLYSQLCYYITHAIIFAYLVL